MSVPENIPESPAVDEAERVLAVAHVLELAAVDTRVHATCGRCYRPDSLGESVFYLGVCGMPALVREDGDEWFDMDTGEPHNPCPACMTAATCAQCRARVEW